MASQDETFMAIALAMARRGLGRTWPNPAVGAVLVSGDGEEILSRGWTLPGGRPHAEVVALERAGERARGATLYVTLEPCAHHGQTPPCADAIVEAGVARIVCSMGDPDPRVSGAGLERLRAGGLDVATGVLECAVRKITRGHVLRVTQGRPEITLKSAVGADGLVAPGTGAPVWVTGEQARKRGHLLRAHADAILVGRGTVEADDPQLTCRLPGMADRSPVRVILDTGLNMSPAAKMLDGGVVAPVWIFSGRDAPQECRRALEARGAEIMTVDVASDGILDPKSVAAALGARGITRLLVEGGPSVARSFLGAGLIDRAVIFSGTAPAGKMGLKPFVDAGLESIKKAKEFSIVESRTVGEDTMAVYENIRLKW